MKLSTNFKRAGAVLDSGRGQFQPDEEVSGGLTLFEVV